MTADQIGMLLFDLAVILLIARLVGAAARRLGQPPVIGEIVVGILLGPTVLGATAGRVVFPLGVRPALTAVANVGLAIFMFIVGLEFDHRVVRHGVKAAAVVSLASSGLPFVMGILLACYVLAGHDVSHHLAAFAVFVGAAMSITSFPVMARLLTDLRMDRVPLGVLALACGATSNVIAWVMLTVAVALGDGGGNLWRAALLLPYLVIMFVVVRPLLRRLVAARRGAGELLAVMLGGLLLSGVVTQWLGLNYIFGAFLFGVIVPTAGAGQLRRDVRERLGGLCQLLLLPVFFVVTGLQVDLRHAGLAGIGEFAAILLVAFSGKYIGAFTAARLLGMDTRRSAALATLMNTRGVTELIVLAIGLQLGVLDHELYSCMVVMTVVTTAAAGPVLRLIYPRRLIDVEGQVAACAA